MASKPREMGIGAEAALSFHQRINPLHFHPLDLRERNQSRRSGLPDPDRHRRKNRALTPIF
jgi:hypothetical protein